jgi:hypothetical protein
LPRIGLFRCDRINENRKQLTIVPVVGGEVRHRGCAELSLVAMSKHADHGANELEVQAGARSSRECCEDAILISRGILSKASLPLEWVYGTSRMAGSIFYVGFKIPIVQGVD